uniref:DNA repair protein RAD51 homolog 3 n=1 Tax=Palpitomonas bilix TaxID=652834 RepID=A0A7S3DKA6_9EUKA|mmetsp:Transcript_41380/g.107196  ORF Transcript_41380/g.107196 Transcript_41380/m.107196 type:complete len:353 (+) Transcript_41380:148-1206(+)
MPLPENFLLSLKPSTRAILAGEYTKSLREFASTTALALSQATRLSPEDANEALNRAKRYLGYEQMPQQMNGRGSQVLSQSALEIFNEKRGKIITFCQGMDSMLGGGVSLREMTEFSGIPGIGKTQLAMQLCANVQIPAFFGGVEGEALYVDTEGSFTPERMNDIAIALHKHLLHMVKSRGKKPEHAKRIDEMCAEEMLKKVFVVRCFDLKKQIGLIGELPNFLRSRPKVRLVVFDSIAFHFRHDLDDHQQRNRLVASAAADLQSVAKKHNVAVVAINQVTTKVEDDSSSIVPALGEAWAHACTTRIFLYFKDSFRVAHLFKSPSLPEETCLYRVGVEGIRGVPRGEKRQRDE